MDEMKEGDTDTSIESHQNHNKPVRQLSDAREERQKVNDKDSDIMDDEITSTKPLKDLAAYKDVLTTLADLVDKENVHLKAQHFKDYDRWSNINDVMTQTFDVCQEYHRTMTQVTWAMSRLRQQLVNLRNTMDSKLTDEGLYSWIEGPLAHPSGMIFNVSNFSISSLCDKIESDYYPDNIIWIAKAIFLLTEDDIRYLNVT